MIKWQNNKAPQSKDAVGADNWVGMNILVQYFRERFYSNAVVMPNKFSRLVLKKSDEEVHQAAAAAEGGVATSQPSYDDTYQYLDTLDDDAMKEALECADAVEMEEDEEYRVRSAVVTAVACLRAKDGLTPPVAIQFLETILESDDAEMVGNLVYDDEQQVIEDTFKRMKARIGEEIFESGALNADQNKTQPRLNYVSSMLVADALLAICHVNSMPAIFTDPATGKTVQSKTVHPLSRLMKAARSWLEWELYRENIRLELAHATQSGVSGNCQDGIAASAVIALSNVAILIQSTTDAPSNERSASELANPNGFLDDVASAKFYINIFDSKPHRNDLTRAASAQALACICCAADRFERGTAVPVGLLTALKFLLDRIIGMCTSLLFCKLIYMTLRHLLTLRFEFC